MSTKNTLNAVLVRRSGAQSLTKPDGTAWSSSDGSTATTLILRTRPLGAQRFASYDPTNPPTTPEP
jgi:hypothetical protein